MDDIKLKILDVLRTDATIQLALGGTTTDPRVYLYYQGDARITPELPGYITFSNISTPEAVNAVESPTFSIVIWTRTWALAEQIRDRVRALFHKQILTTAAPDSRRIYAKIVGEQDSYQDQPKYAGKTLHLRAGWSTV